MSGGTAESALFLSERHALTWPLVQSKRRTFFRLKLPAVHWCKNHTIWLRICQRNS